MICTSEIKTVYFSKRPTIYSKPSVDISWQFHCCQSWPKVNKLFFLLLNFFYFYGYKCFARKSSYWTMMKNINLIVKFCLLWSCEAVKRDFINEFQGERRLRWAYFYLEIHWCGLFSKLVGILKHKFLKNRCYFIFGQCKNF